MGTSKKKTGSRDGKTKAEEIERLIGLDAQEIIRILLESAWALPTVDTKEAFERLHDDHDGTRQGKIGVIRAIDGDMHVYIQSDSSRTMSMRVSSYESDWLRFRSAAGGGRSLRTHNALRILAEAIRLDAIQDPHT
jgi:hypothetical protein